MCTMNEMTGEIEKKLFFMKDKHQLKDVLRHKRKKSFL